MNEYDQQAEDFLIRNGIGLEINQLDTKSPDWDKKSLRWRYQVVMRQSGVNDLSFNFWDSINNYKQEKVPVAYDILACISSSYVNTMTLADVQSDFGIDYTQAQRVIEFSQEIAEFFTKEQLEQLMEIN